MPMPIPMYHPRKVVVPQNIVKTLDAETRKFSGAGVETGGYIIGKIYEANRLYEIMYLIDAGPNASRSGAMFSPDNVYASQKKEELRKKDPLLRLLAEWHLHPWSGDPHPSAGDFEGLLSIKSGKPKPEVVQASQQKPKRPWYIIWLWNGNGSWHFFDINEDGTDWRVVPHQVVAPPNSTSITQKELMQRISSSTRNDLLASKKVLAIGLGSGGATVTKFLSATALGYIALLDPEQLEPVNLIRHEGSIRDLGTKKCYICKEMVESRNPYIVAEAYAFDALEDSDKLRKLVLETDFDLILSLTGNAKVNLLVNNIALEHKIPTVYAGVFSKASGGYILSYDPYIEENPCFNCLFDIVSQSYYVDTQTSRNYDIPIEELHGQQGLWVDISFVSLMATKVAMRILEEDSVFLRNNNLFLYKKEKGADPFKMEAMKFKRRKDCVSCNFSTWMKVQEGNLAKRIKEGRYETDKKHEKRSPFKEVFQKGLRFRFKRCSENEKLKDSKLP